MSGAPSSRLLGAVCTGKSYMALSPRPLQFRALSQWPWSTPTTSLKMCWQCQQSHVRLFSSLQRSRWSSKRQLMTNTISAYRTHKLETSPSSSPPRNIGISETSKAGGLNEDAAAFSPSWPGRAPPAPSLSALSHPITQTSITIPLPSSSPSAPLSSAPSQQPGRALRPVGKSRLRARKAAMTLTSSAVHQLRQLLDSPEPKLIRIGVKNKGCSGSAYHLEYVEAPAKLDEQVDQDGVKVLIDSKALIKVIGSEMDWVEDKLSARFTFRNPNISKSSAVATDHQHTEIIQLSSVAVARALVYHKHICTTMHIPLLIGLVASALSCVLLAKAVPHGAVFNGCRRDSQAALEYSENLSFQDIEYVDQCHPSTKYTTESTPIETLQYLEDDALAYLPDIAGHDVDVTLSIEDPLPPEVQRAPWPNENPVYSNGLSAHPDGDWHTPKGWKDWTKESPEGHFVAVNVSNVVPEEEWVKTNYRFRGMPVPWYALEKGWNETFAKWQKLRIEHQTEAHEYTKPENFPMCFDVHWVNMPEDRLKDLYFCHQHLFNDIPQQECGAHWGNPQIACRRAKSFVELHYLGSEHLDVTKRTAHTKCFNVAAGIWWILSSCTEGMGQAIIQTEHSLLAIKIHDWSPRGEYLREGDVGGLTSLLYDNP